VGKPEKKLIKPERLRKAHTLEENAKRLSVSGGLDCESWKLFLRPPRAGEI
jgi:hypothetical protein